MERVGVEAIFDVSAFEAGLDRYIAGLTRANQATADIAGNIDAAVTQAAASVISKLNSILPTVNTVASGLSALKAQLNGITAAVENNATTAQDAAQDAIAATQAAKAAADAADAANEAVATPKKRATKPKPALTEADAIAAVAKELDAATKKFEAARTQAVENLNRAAQEALNPEVDDQVIKNSRRLVQGALTQVENQISKSVDAINKKAVDLNIGDRFAAEIAQVQAEGQKLQTEIATILQRFDEFKQFYGANRQRALASAQPVVAAPVDPDAQIRAQIADISKDIADQLKVLESSRDRLSAVLGTTAQRAFDDNLNLAGFDELRKKLAEASKALVDIIAQTTTDINAQGKQIDFASTLIKQLSELRDASKTLGQEIATNLAVIDKRVLNLASKTARTAGAQGAQAGAAVGLPDPNALAAVTAEYTDFSARLVTARDNALRLLASATNRAANQALDARDLQQLQAQLRNLTTSIDTDFRTVQNTVSQLKRGANIGPEVADQVTQVRNAIQAVKTEIQNASGAFDAQFSGVTKTLAQVGGANSAQQAQAVAAALAQVTAEAQQYTLALSGYVSQFQNVLARATQTASTVGFTAQDEANLKAGKKTILDQIGADLAATERRFKEFGADVDIGDQIRAQMSTLRDQVKATTNQINLDLDSFKAKFSTKVSFTAEAAQLQASAQAKTGLDGVSDLIVGYVQTLQNLRGRIITLLSTASNKALTETLNPGEIAALRGVVSRTLVEITNEMENAASRVAELGAAFGVSVGDELRQMRQLTRLVKDDINTAAKAFDAQFQTKGKTTAAPDFSAAEKKAADSLANVLIESNKFAQRLEVARQTAVKAIQEASTKALTDTISPQELQGLRNLISQVTQGITSDLSLTVNELNRLGKDANIGDSLREQITVLRNAVAQTTNELNRLKGTFDASFRTGGKTLGTPATFGEAQGLGQAYLANLQKERDRILAELNSLGGRAAQGLISSRELTSYKRAIQRDLSDLMTSLQNTIGQMRDLGRAGGFGNSLSTTFNTLRGELRKARQEINAEYQTIVRDTYNFKGGMQSVLGALFTQGFVLGLGIEAFNALSRAVRELVQVGREGLQITQFFEQLNISLETLIARDISKANGIEDFSEALKQAKPLAGGLLIELEKLAVFSPFTTEGIADAYRTANSYGFAADEALRLTRALVDFTSGAGLNQQVLGRIALALSQIYTSGKLAGQEVRQLAEAGVPIYDILGKAFGKTTAELRKLQADGLLEGRAVAEAVISYFETTFKGAALRVSMTITGLLSSIQDIRQLALRDIFTGVFTPLIPILDAIVKFTTTNEFRASLRVIGELIGTFVAGAVTRLILAFQGLRKAWAEVTPQTKELLAIFLATSAVLVTLVATIGAMTFVVSALVNPITVVIAGTAALYTAWVSAFNDMNSITRRSVDFIVGLFNDLVAQANDWGFNITSSLSDGILGAADLIVNALNFIGDTITYWLKPGSPPRLLPDLDKWGTGAANAYFEGWQLADFSILDKMANGLEGYFKNLVDRNLLDEMQVPQLAIGGTEAIARALDQFRESGNVTKQIFDQLRSAGQGFGSVLVDYVNLYMNAARATAEVAAEQDDLNIITQRYKDILTPLKDRLEEINDAQNAGEEAKRIRQLNNIINNRYASEARKKQALLELEKINLERSIRGVEKEQTAATEAAQAELDAAKKAEERANSELAKFEARLGQQTKYNSLLADEVKLQEKAAKAAEQAAKEAERKAKEAQQEQLRRISIMQEELRDLLRIYELNYTLQKGGLTVAQETAIQIELEEIAVKRLQRALEAMKLGVNLGYLRDVEFVPADLPSKLTKAAEGLGDLEGKLGGIADLDLAGTFEEFGKTVDEVRDKYKQLGEQVDLTMQKIDNSLPSFLKFRLPPIEGPKTQDQSGFLTGFELPEGGIGGTFERTVPLVESLKNALIGLAAYLVTTKIGGLLAAIGVPLGPLQGKLGLISIAVTGLYLAFDQNWFGVRDAVTEALDRISEAVDNLGISFENITFDNIGKAYDDLNKKVGEFFGGNFDLNAIFAGLRAILTSQVLGNSIKTVIPYLIIFGGGVKTVFNVLKPFFALFTAQAVKSGIKSLVPALKGLIPILGGIAVGGARGLLPFLKGLLPLLAGVAVKFNLAGVAGNLFMLALEQNWFGFRDITYTVLSSIANFFDTIFMTGGTIRKNFDAIWDYIGTTYTNFLHKLLAGEMTWGDFVDQTLAPFQGIYDGIVKIIDKIKYYLTYDSFGDFIGKIFIELPGELIGYLADAFTEFFNGIPGFVAYSATAWGRNIGAIFEFFFGTFMAGMVRITDLIFTGILAIFDEGKRGEFWDKLEEFFGGVLDWIGELFGPDFGKEIEESWDIAWNTHIKPSLGELVTSIKELFTEKWDSVMLPAIKEGGRLAAEGLFDGFQEYVDSFGVGWASKAVKAILDNFRQQLGIESPSTVFRDEIGKQGGEGLIIGLVQSIVDGIPDAIKALADLIAAMFSSDALTSYAQTAYNAGVLIKDNIVKGLTDAAGVVATTLTDWFKTITGSFGWLFGYGPPPDLPTIPGGPIVPQVEEKIDASASSVDQMFEPTGIVGRQIGPAAVPVNNNSVTTVNNYNLSVTTKESVGDVRYDFGRMRVFATG